MSEDLPRIRQEEDGVRALPVLYYLAALSVIGVGLVTWSWFALRANERLHGRAPLHVPVPAAAATMGGISQTLINVDTTVQSQERRAEQQLASWAWIDRQHGIARIPIEAAMQALIDTVHQ